MRWPALLALGLLACDRPSTGVTASPSARPSASAAPSASSAAPSASSASSAAPTASAPVGAGGPWVGCYGGFRPGSTPLRDVTRVGLLCGPANGMRPVAPAWEGRLDEGAQREHVFSVERGQCVRAFAVGDGNIRDLDLTLLDPRASALGADSIDDRWPILPPDGTICALSDGPHTLRVAARKGSGSYAAQVWLLP